MKYRRKVRKPIQSIWILFLVLFVIIISIYAMIFGQDLDWRKKTFSTDLHINISDQRLINHKRTFPLSIHIEDKTFSLKSDTTLRIYLKPGDFQLKLETNSGQLLLKEKLEYYGVKHLHYSIDTLVLERNNKYIIKTEFMNFYKI